MPHMPPGHDPLPASLQSAAQHPHPPVPWWQEISPTIKAALDLPPLLAPIEQPIDVIIIGAGIAGLSAALSASQAGARVVVLDKSNRLGHGATGRNAGILSAGINMGLTSLGPDSPITQFWPDTTHVLHELVAEAARPDSLLAARLTGSLSLAETKNAARYLTREAQARTALGLRAEIWTPQQVQQATNGHLNVASVVNAMWLPDEGRIHPLTLLAHVAQQARAAGARIFGQTEVVVYDKTNSRQSHRRWRLMLRDGTQFETAGIVNAVGPTAHPNARIFALAFDADLPETFPLFWDASPYTYADYRPGNGRLTVSGGRYGKAGKTRHDTRYYENLIAGTRRWLPELAAQAPRHTWAVDLHVTADMIPMLSQIEAGEHGYIIEGLGALGVLPGILLGRRAGQLAAHSEEIGHQRYYFEQLDIER